VVTCHIPVAHSQVNVKRLWERNGQGADLCRWNTTHVLSGKRREERLLEHGERFRGGGGGNMIGGA
jgi:hypothetical protein